MEQGELELVIEKPEFDIATEPLVWIKELRIYKDYSTQEVLREIKLHKGCNVLWSAPSADTEIKLYDSGLSGHAAGKTTFCRLLRYGLGEKSYGNEHLQERIDGRFINGRVVAEVSITGETWLVSLPLGCGDTAFVIQDGSFDLQFDSDLSKEPIKIYHDKLEDALSSKLPATFNDERKILWRHILPSVSRDQECRYSSFLSFRHTDSNSHTQNMSTEDKVIALKALCGFIDSEESKLATELEAYKRDLSAKVNEIEALSHKYETIKDFFFEGLENPPAEDALFFQDKYKTVLKEYEKVQGSIEKSDLSPQTKLIQVRFEDLNEEYVLLWNDYKKELQDLELDKIQLSNLKGEERKKDRDLYNAKNDKPRGRCNTPLQIAYSNNCPCVEGSVTDFQSLIENKKGMTEQRKELSEWISKKEGELKELLASVQGKKKELTSLEAQYKESLLQDRLNDRKLFKREAELERELESLERALSFEREMKALTEEQSKIEKNILKTEKNLNSLRSSHKWKVRELQTLYTDVLQACIGKEVSSELAFHANRIHAEVVKNGVRRSAAIDTIKLLALDLALMKYSINSQGYHPRFLIHDSPREADLAKDIYSRFLMYAAKNMMPKELVENYQYIITTTEPPPKELQEEGYLLKPILNASKAEERLFKMDL